ncbi:hypothetical protein KUH32_18315 [Thalassococcus sp. CAU 1522]|uniref:Uncharacterized protein n=1 Tax=Thalassococcus arenae TaxID=2851652 RepID=A0ABS6NCH0_9RHOB|nr:hypothetical protein [Thalassococcus arenae]MBV2361724.1 hypothetical protein [Thalassococcus arenae]
MTQDILRRIEGLRVELNGACGTHREALLDKLEQAVAVLDSTGRVAPAWARARLADRIDEAVEEQFDNMPV